MSRRWEGYEGRVIQEIVTTSTYSHVGWLAIISSFLHYYERIKLLI